MRLQIEKISLYNQHGDVRELSFKKSCLNIITGASKTGKSAISEIISYCLGREEFTIPAGIIRDKVSWYGLTIKIGGEDIFIARKKPENHKKTSFEILLDINPAASAPLMSEMQPNTNLDGLSSFLSEKIGISENLQENHTYSTLAPIKAKLKHSLIFCFQQQGEIADKQNLFHRQNVEWVPNSIRLTAPYFLGAMPEDQISSKYEIISKKKEIKKLHKELEEMESVQGAGMNAGLRILTEAEEVGLTQSINDPKDISELIAILQEIRVGEKELLTTGDAICRLRRERESLLEKYDNIKRKIEITKTYSNENSEFRGEAEHQVNRLNSLGLIKSLSKEKNLSTVDLEIQKSLIKLENQLSLSKNNKSKLSSHIKELEGKITEIKDELRSNQKEIKAATLKREEIQSALSLESNRAKVLGKIELYLDSVKPAVNYNEIKEKIDLLTKKLLLLEEEFKNNNSDEILSSFLNLISEDMTKWARDLDLEHKCAKFRLDLKNLTVVADTESGPVPMKNMGSGANWIGCHLITYLALHKWFSKKKRPVPGFIILDQPSQAFYPPEEELRSYKALPDEDRQAVDRMYRWLYKQAIELEDLQIIVIDHVDIKSESWFQEAIVERWRDGKALIPLDW